MIRLDFSYFIKSFFIIISRVIRRNPVAFVVCIILFSTLFLSIGLITTKAAVKDNEPKVKQIISLKIQEGDTLWGIASEYITSEYDNMNEFIEEIKTTNGLSSDTIHEGAYLIVPYYQ
ncbi:MAG: LysM peptidoglycan-binding domain-containing protein [Anaerocolumna sp.]